MISFFQINQLKEKKRKENEDKNFSKFNSYSLLVTNIYI